MITTWRPRRQSLRLIAGSALGILLPIVCFAVDHALKFHVYGGWTSTVRVFVVCEMLVFGWWLFRTPGAACLRAGIAATCAVGACFAALSGLGLLHWSVVGVLLGIGVLGLVPFGTATVFGLAATELACSVHREDWRQAVVGGVVAAAISLAPAVLWRTWEVGLLRRVEVALEEPTDWKSVETLVHQLPSCDGSYFAALCEQRRADAMSNQIAVWLNRGWLESLRTFMEADRQQ